MYLYIQANTIHVHVYILIINLCHYKELPNVK